LDYHRLFVIADRARSQGRLSAADRDFVVEALPADLAPFPRVKLPAAVRHPAGFAIRGAPVGTFLRSALLLSGRKVLGNRYRGSSFYERVEQDLALRIMRSHFHHGYPKGTHCCAQCTLAVYPVLEANAIRYFDCRSLARAVQEVVEGRQWRFTRSPNAKILEWAKLE
jgi:hypothetical protein